MFIGGFQRVSFIDYPGKIAAVIFTQGCNFRCRYCHNSELVFPSCFAQPLDEREIFDFLETRKDKIQGVVISGGEPTIQKDIIPFLKRIKELGYYIKVDTNGSRPHVLRRMIDACLVNFIAMDIKAPLDRYPEIIGVSVNPDYILESVTIICRSGIEHQFRTTMVKPFALPDDLSKITSMIGCAKEYRLQPFKPSETVLDYRLLDKGHYTEQEFAALQKKWERKG